MRPRRASWLPCLALLSAPLVSLAAEPDPPAAPTAEAAGPARWEVSGSANAYFMPDDENFTIPIVIANRAGLHLEARYNYEALETGSLFAGMNLEWGDRLILALTPMLGFTIGAVQAVVPGFEADLSFGSFNLYTEFEYLIDVEDAEGNFLYNWSELTWEPGGGFRLGMTTQRTRVYDTDRSVQRALLLGYAAGALSLTAHLFNPGDDDHFLVFALGASF